MSAIPRHRNSALLGLVAVFFWSASAPFSKLLQGHAGFPVIVLFMQIGAILALLLMTILTVDGMVSLRRDFARLFMMDDDADGGGTPLVRQWAYLLVFAGFITAYHSLFFYSLQNGPSLQLNMINYLWPVNLVIVSVLFFRRNVQNAGTLIEFALVPLAFFGAIIIGFDGQNLTDLEFTWPLAAAFGASVCAPIYMALGPKIVGDGYVSNSKNLYILSLSAAAICQVVIYFSTGVLKDNLSNTWAIPVSLVLGVTSIAIAHVCWTDALESSRRATISTLIYLTPILSSVWLVSFFGETVTGQFLLGASIILLANILMSRALDEFLPVLFGVVATGYATVGWFGRAVFREPSLAPEAYEIIPGIFAILAGFMLSRMWARNAELERLYIDWIYRVHSLASDVRSSDTGVDSELLTELEDRIDQVMRTSLDVKMRPSSRSEAAASIVHCFSELMARLAPLAINMRARSVTWIERTEAAEVSMLHWLNRVEERSSRAEKAVILLLGAGSIISLIVQLTFSFNSVLLSLVFSFCIAYIIAEIRMYEHMSARVCFTALASGSLRTLFKDGKLYLPEQWLLSALCRRGATLGDLRYRTISGAIEEITSSQVARVAHRVRNVDTIIGLLALICLGGMVTGLLISDQGISASAAGARQ